MRHRSSPFGAGFAQGQIHQFFRRADTRKVPACAYRAAHGRIQTFDRTSGIDRLANQPRKGKKGNHVSPSLPLRAHYVRISPPQLTLLKIIQQ